MEDEAHLIGYPLVGRKLGNLVEILRAVVGDESEEILRNVLLATLGIIDGERKRVGTRLEKHVLRVLGLACPYGIDTQRAARGGTIRVGGRSGVA